MARNTTEDNRRGRNTRFMPLLTIPALTSPTLSLPVFRSVDAPPKTVVSPRNRSSLSPVRKFEERISPLREIVTFKGEANEIFRQA